MFKQDNPISDETEQDALLSKQLFWTKEDDHINTLEELISEQEDHIDIINQDIEVLRKIIKQIKQKEKE